MSNDLCYYWNLLYIICVYKDSFLFYFQTASEDLKLWRDLNTSRNVLSIVGWFIISLSPLTDRLTENLQEADEEDLLGVEVETGKSAIA